MNNLAIAPKPAKFETIAPGSTVRIADLNGDLPTIEALVLESHEEYGGFGLPALVLLEDGSDEPTIKTQNGRWLVDILQDGNIAALAGKILPPEGAFTALPKTTEVVVVEFTGGARLASELIKWSVGKAVLTYNAGDAITPEALHLRTLAGHSKLGRGDYLVREGDRFTVVTGAEFGAHYEAKRAE